MWCSSAIPLGGRSALRYAAAHPDRVSALVLIDVGPELQLAGVRRRTGKLRQKLEETPRGRWTWTWDPSCPWQLDPVGVRRNIGKAVAGRRLHSAAGAYPTRRRERRLLRCGRRTTCHETPARPLAENSECRPRRSV